MNRHRFYPIRFFRRTVNIARRPRARSTSRCATSSRPPTTRRSAFCRGKRRCSRAGRRSCSKRKRWSRPSSRSSGAPSGQRSSASVIAHAIQAVHSTCEGKWAPRATWTAPATVPISSASGQGVAGGSRPAIAQGQDQSEKRKPGDRMSGRQTTAGVRLAAAVFEQVPRARHRTVVLERDDCGRDQRHIQGAAPQRPAPEEAQEPEPHHEPVQAGMAQDVERPHVAQRKSPLRRVVKRRDQLPVEMSSEQNQERARRQRGEVRAQASRRGVLVLE